MTRSLLMSGIAGMRSIMPLAVISLAAARQRFTADKSIHRFVRSPAFRYGGLALAAAELRGDKLTSAPHRIVAPGTAARLFTGSLAGMALLNHPRMSESWVGPISQAYEPDKGLRVHSASGHDIVMNERDVSWSTADGSVSLKGTMVTPRAHFLVPWRDPEQDKPDQTGLVYWTAQLWIVKGTLFGEPVEGFIDLDQSYSKGRYGKTPFGKTMQAQWTGFANEYDDGTVEFGHFMCGQGGFTGAWLTNSKGQELINTQNITIHDIKKNADGTLQGYRWTIGGKEEWEYVVNPSTTEKLIPAGSSVDDDVAAAAKRQGETFLRSSGMVIRSGEHRKVKRYWGMTEYVAGRTLCTGQQS